MKKAFVLSNLMLLSISLLLGYLLYDARTQLQFAAQNAVMPTPLSTPLFAPAAQPTEMPKDKEDKTLLYLKPYGTLPAECVYKYCSRYSMSSTLSLEEDNPIDAFFNRYWLAVCSTMEENAMAADYMDCWKAEMLHVYDLLAKKANPSIESLGEELAETKNAMLEFAVKDASLYANIIHTDAYGTEGGSYDETFTAGTGWPGFSAMAEAAHYRAYTIYLYGLLSTRDVTPDFVFDPHTMEEAWELFEK